jgi:hypothetical protein
LVVQQVSYAPDHQDFVVLVVTAITATLDRSKLGELLLPIAQYMRLDTAQLAHFTDGEIAFGRDGRKRTVHERQQVTWKTL